MSRFTSEELRADCGVLLFSTAMSTLFGAAGGGILTVPLAMHAPGVNAGITAASAAISSSSIFLISCCVDSLHMDDDVNKQLERADETRQRWNLSSMVFSLGGVAAASACLGHTGPAAGWVILSYLTGASSVFFLTRFVDMARECGGNHTAIEENQTVVDFMSYSPYRALISSRYGHNYSGDNRTDYDAINQHRRGNNNQNNRTADNNNQQQGLESAAAISALPWMS